MPEPLLSFVIPVYNPPLDVLNELLDSVAAQTEPRWECVLIDDASPNGAVREILAARQAHDPRFVVILREANGGISAATNDGLDAATAPIIAFTDHDDLVDPDAVATLVAHFDSHPNDGLVYTDERLVDADGNQKATYPKPDYSPIRHLGHNYLNHITAVRRTAMGDIRIRSSFEPAQDADFGHRVIERLAATGGSVGHIPRPLYSWRAIDASSASDASVKTGMFQSIRNSITASIERENLALEASTVYEDGRATTAVRLDPPPVASDEIEVLPLTVATTPADVNRAIASCSRRFLVLCPTDIVADDSMTTTDWINVVASDVSRPGVVAAGPTLIRADRHILSVGRSVELGLDDPYWDHRLSGGPWGAWLVTREVTAVAPECLAVDVEQARQLSPLPEVADLNVAVAVWCDQARRRGSSTIITPRATVALERFRLIDPPQNARRLVDLAAAVRQTHQTPVEHYATTDPIAVRHFPSAWAIIDHLISIDQIDVLSISLENGLVAQRSSADPTPVLDLDAMTLISRAREQGTRVCIISRKQPSAAAVKKILDEAGGDVGLIDVIFTCTDETWTDETGTDETGTDETGTVGTSHDPEKFLADAWRLAVGTNADLVTSRVAHLGADLNDDLEPAARLGAIALLLDVAPPYHLAPRPGPQLSAWINGGGDDGGLARLTRSTLVDAGDLASTPGYQLGVAVLGPLVVGGYHDSIDHPVLRALLALVTTPAVTSSATAPFDPGDERAGNQQAVRRAVHDLDDQLNAANIPWSNPEFRAALVADAIAAVDHPTPLLEALLTLWSNGEFAASPTSATPTSATPTSATNASTRALDQSDDTFTATPARLARGATRRVRSFLGRQ